MPFVFAFIALVLIAVGVRGETSAATKLLQSEFTGSNSFIPWLLAVMILGMIGYIKPVRPVADAMLGLVILSIVLVEGSPNRAGGGFFAQLNAAFTGATPAQTPATSSGTSSQGQTAAPLAPTSPGVTFLPSVGSFDNPTSTTLTA